MTVDIVKTIETFPLPSRVAEERIETLNDHIAVLGRMIVKRKHQKQKISDLQERLKDAKNEILLLEQVLKYRRDKRWFITKIFRKAFSLGA